MRITQDKFNETRYHFRRLNEMLDLITGTSDFAAVLQPIEYFRYEINSFVNSHRATTFALQAEHKSKLGERFIVWYEKALQPLMMDDFSKVLKELRNINQKEGNIYPKFEFKCDLPESIFYLEVDFTDADNNFAKVKRFEIKKEFDIQISDVIIDKIGELTIEDEMKIWSEFTPYFAAQHALMVKSTSYTIHKLTIDRFGKEYSPEEFLENLKRMGKLLQDMVEDGWNVLNTPS